MKKSVKEQMFTRTLTVNKVRLYQLSDDDELQVSTVFIPGDYTEEDLLYIARDVYDYDPLKVKLVDRGTAKFSLPVTALYRFGCPDWDDFISERGLDASDFLNSDD